MGKELKLGIGEFDRLFDLGYKEYLIYAGMPNKETFSCVVYDPAGYAYNLFFPKEDLPKELNISRKRFKVLDVSADSIVLEIPNKE